MAIEVNVVARDWMNSIQRQQNHLAVIVFAQRAEILNSNLLQILTYNPSDTFPFVRLHSVLPVMYDGGVSN